MALTKFKPRLIASLSSEPKNHPQCVNILNLTTQSGVGVGGWGWGGDKKVFGWMVCCTFISRSKNPNP